MNWSCPLEGLLHRQICWGLKGCKPSFPLPLLCPSAGSPHHPTAAWGYSFSSAALKPEKSSSAVQPWELVVSSPPAPHSIPHLLRPTQRCPYHESWQKVSHRGRVSAPPTTQDPHAPSGKTVTSHHRYHLHSLLACFLVEREVPRLAAYLSGCSKAFLALRRITFSNEST